MQWWLKDAGGARRCLVTGLMLPNVCIMDREHDVTDREDTEFLLQTGGCTMDECFGCASPLNPLNSFNPLMSG